MNKKMQNGGYEINFRNILLLILLLIVILVVLYVIYKTVQTTNLQNSKSPILIADVIDGYVERPGVSVLTPTDGLGMTISTWIYIKDWQYNFGKYKPIINKSSNSSDINNGCPSISLYPDTNALKVVTRTTFGSESCDLQNLPLQTWVHICYVLDNRNVDLYINGKLERSTALKGIPLVNNSQIYITPSTPNNTSTPGFMGKIGRTQYFSYTITPNKVVDLYQYGPIGSPQYKVQFFQNGKFMDIQNQSIMSANK